MSYPKYAWVGNRISEGDMKKLYEMKKTTKKPITRIVAEAVKVYLEQRAQKVLKP